MDDKNELSDIVLNKGNASGSNKKIILAIATLGVVLIIVLMLMSSMNSGSTDNLPQAVLPPKPQKETVQENVQEEPLFEEVQVIEDDSSTDADLDKIAQKLKEESQTEAATAPVKKAPDATKTVNKPVKTTTKKVAQTATTGIKYYIQVGSFSRYEPNKKFLRSIKNLGFNYRYHKVGNLNKVLVGPFNTRKEANNAKRVLRAKVEPGAFLVKL
ncbi:MULTISPECIES: SPOR domain-containing protein [Sulfurimonas]|uniref:SPOR domain-containing protein n=1 Tax=Sulfurimonas TaxID=202746 RepID=UPI0012647FB9|nr:SPOR domain-containing protein [Sulfurimonas indica]